jgi:hypothetical protein
LHENKGIDGWNGRLIEEQRTLACSLLIKCADISNVVCSFGLLCGSLTDGNRHEDMMLQLNGR